MFAHNATRITQTAPSPHRTCNPNGSNSHRKKSGAIGYFFGAKRNF